MLAGAAVARLFHYVCFCGDKAELNSCMTFLRQGQGLALSSYQATASEKELNRQRSTFNRLTGSKT